MQRHVLSSNPGWHRFICTVCLKLFRTRTHAETCRGPKREKKAPAATKQVEPPQLR
jgi:hypothetical protein